jgi:putative ABC transport system permease protein
MDKLFQDIRYGLRALLNKPAFTIVAVLALALGIGANTAIFSVVNSVLLRPLPYPDSERLVMVWEERSSLGFPSDTPAPANFFDWREQQSVFEDMAAIANRTINLTGTGEPEKIEAQRVSASFFPLVGVAPMRGRMFLPEDDRPESSRVVIIGHALWQRRFGGDEGLLNQTILLDGQPHTVVGIMPPDFDFPERNQMWVPIAFSQDEASRRGSHYLLVVARLKQGISLAQAQTEMSAIAARLEQQYPATNTALGAKVVPIQEELVGNLRPALLILLGAVALVLLIACANVANLLLARAASRQKEIAIRSALGANRSRLVRQFLTESMLLSIMGGAAGLLLAFVGVKSLTALIPPELFRGREIFIDAWVLGFTIALSLLTGVIFGLAPAIQSAKINLNETLKEGGKGAGATVRPRLRSALVIAEISLALVLLVGAGLLINSFLRLSNVEPGFKPENLLTVEVVPQQNKYDTVEKRAAFYSEMLERIGALAGVESAGVITNLPLTFKGNNASFTVEGRPEPPPDQVPIAATRAISPDYLRTMSIQLMSGRGFTRQDINDRAEVAIISETMARTYWPGEEAVGKRIKIGRYNSTSPWVTIIGVAANVRQFELETETRPLLYLPYTQVGYFAPRHLVVKTAGEPLGFVAAVREAVWSVDRDQPVSNVSTMETIVSESLAGRRLTMLLLGIFAGLALLLAAVGIYGVISYAVAQRTHEIGIRMALGASSRKVLGLVVGDSLKLIAIGVGLGLAAAFFLTRYMRSLLYGVSETDPVTFAVIPVLLAAVALAASYIPARRATRVDPMVALRHE